MITTLFLLCLMAIDKDEDESWFFWLFWTLLIDIFNLKLLRGTFLAFFACLWALYLVGLFQRAL